MERENQPEVVAEATEHSDPEDPKKALKPPATPESKKWKEIRKWSCLSGVGLVIVGIAVAMICVGVLPSKGETVTVLVAAVRVRYIAVEEVKWTFTPGGKDLIYGELQGTYVNHTTPTEVIEGTFIKGQYVEYNDSSFKHKVQRDANWEHLGVLGPMIHAEAGDTIDITLRNLLAVPVNLEPMGNSWAIEGMLGPIGSGKTATFRINIPAEAGPPAGSPQSSTLCFFRSSLNPTRHENSGLVGGIIVTRKGEANPDGTPKGVDREVVTVFQIYNEIETEFITFNAANASKFGWSTDRYTINGYSFGTLQTLNFKAGEKVRWYVGGLGTENGMHNFHWHGNVLEMDGRFMDQVTAIPATTRTLDMVPDNPGRWFYHCHINSHLTNGMAAIYTVDGPMPPPTTGGKVRTYYIAADEVEWNYLPLDGIACTVDGSVDPVEEGTEAANYLGEPDGTRIGSKYIKGQFREYTDDTFTTLKERSAEDAYLGLLGPVLRAQVGDTIKIVFKNQMSEHATTLHPHGVLYNKSSEGSPYMDGTTGYDKADDAVMPGDTHTYIWEVPERAGPGEHDPSSIMWMYHSHADEVKDTWAGLAGAMVITRRGADIKADGSPSDVDSEKILFFAAMDESMSLFSDANIAKYLGEDVNSTALYEDEAFLASSLHRSINGFMYCNMPRPEFTEGTKIRFHYMALGDIGDMHTPSMGRGGGFLALGQREDAIQMSAGAMHSVDVVLTEPGTWKLGCNVLEHEAGGVVAMYNVLDGESAAQEEGVVRTFYIQAENATWNYAPNGYVQCGEVNLTIRSQIFLNHSSDRIGSIYHKKLFRQYTDATFTTLTPQPDYMGALGPLIVLETGDKLRVVLKNNIDFDINFNPGGGMVATGDPTLGQAVAPGETFEYEWVVPKEAGPTDDGLSSVGYGYSSTVDHWTHSVLGLEGVIVVVHKGMLGPDNKPKGVDYLIPLLWQVFDENLSPYLDQNMVAAGIDVSAINKEDPDFIESNIMHTINGYMYCNLPSPRVRVGTKSRWIFMSVGATEGLHAPVFVKVALVDAEGSHGSVQLMPGYTSTMDVITNSVGKYPMFCNVHDHIEAGMMGTLEVIA